MFWPILALLVLCLIVLAVMSDIQTGPKIETEPLKGIPIVLDDVVIDKLLFNPNFNSKRKQAIEFYAKQVNRTDKQSDISAILDSSPDNIATINVNKFEPINLNYTKQECMQAPLQMMHRFNISVLVMQEVPINMLNEFYEVINNDILISGRKIYHTIDDFDAAFANSREPITNVVLSYYPIVSEKKVILTAEPDYIFRHRHAIFFRVPAHPIYGEKLFCTTHLEVGAPDGAGIENMGAIRGRKNQLNDIFTYNKIGPDIILGDFNFWPDSPEYAKIAAKYQIDMSDIDYTIPNYRNLGYENGKTVVDYICFRKNDKQAIWSIKSYAINYPWSDHRPVIGAYTK